MTDLKDKIIKEVIEMYIFSKSDEDELYLGALLEEYLKLSKLDEEYTVIWEE